MRLVSFMLIVTLASLAAGGPAWAQTAAPDEELTSDVPETFTQTIEGSTVTFEMVSVPGDEGAGVGPMWVGRTEVPWELYDIYVFGLDEGGVQTSKGADATSRPSKPYVLPGEGFGHEGHPALAMTYHGAQQFAAWLSQKTGETYRLPTEAEWEYVCQTGYASDADLDAVAWYWGNADDRTHEVGSQQPNRYGAYDFLGNVAEWVTVAEGEPVIKGGSFDSTAENISCEARQAQTPAWNASDPQLPKSKWWLPDAPFVGFRLVREAPTDG